MNRKNSQGLVTVYKADKELKESGVFTITGKGGVILNNDNDEARELLESCYQKRKTVLNPIINWTDEDIWEFIHRENIPYCKLYDEGEKRLGCIGCPLPCNRTMEQDFAKYPKYKELYLKAFGTMIAERERVFP